MKESLDKAFQNRQADLMVPSTGEPILTDEEARKAIEAAAVPVAQGAGEIATSTTAQQEQVDQAAVRQPLDFGRIESHRGQPVSPDERAYMESAHEQGKLHTV